MAYYTLTFKLPVLDSKYGYEEISEEVDVLDRAPSESKDIMFCHY
jgi:hypothetical protein